MRFRVEFELGRSSTNDASDPTEDLESMSERIEASYHNLDQVIGWINNADNKALILLAFQGAVIAAVAALGPNVLEPRWENQPTWAQGAIVAQLIGFAGCFSYSLYRAARAISPDVTTSEQQIGRHSPFFFGSIAGMTLDDFRVRIRALSPARVEEELIKNTYVVAGIAARKFRDVRRALVFLLLAWMFLLTTVITATTISATSLDSIESRGSSNDHASRCTRLSPTVR